MSEKKVIRFQIDMLYSISSDLAEEFFTRDRNFFEAIKESFGKWKEDPNEVRTPLEFDLRFHIGDAADDEED